MMSPLENDFDAENLPDTVKARKNGPGDEEDSVREQRFVDRYRVKRLLGHGGMGIVYLCHDEVADVEVAVKQIPSPVALQGNEWEEVRENFALIQNLYHPNIAGVKVLEQDPDGENCYLVMEFVQGVDLQKFRKRHGGKFALNIVLPILRQIADALDYGHAEGIVHRDIKPGNIMISASGRVKVLDYGIAARIHDSISRLSGTPSRPVGTASYMAPEQWRGRTATAAADQYALAVVAYELLGENPPFVHEDSGVLREIVLNENPKPLDGLPRAIWKVLSRALAKDPTDRFESCSDFVSALEKVDADTATIEPKPSRKPAAILVAVALLAMAAGGLWWAFQDRPESSRSARDIRATVAAPAEAPLSMKYHALVIGISDYRSKTKGWSDLRNARRDAEAVGDVLETDYGFAVSRLLDGDATRASIIGALDRIATLGTPDAALIYYAGHGYYEERLDEGYWIPSDAMGIDGGTGRLLPKQDWVWNSTITKLLDASRARHILVIADSCYGGSLARGTASIPAGRQLNWYERTIRVPSRYVIASGNLEPVPDSGIGHSVFARHLLNSLQYPEQDVFSAGDLAVNIRGKVSALTGRHVTATHLPLSSHAGGEFVFIKASASGASNLLATAATPPEDSDPAPGLQTSETPTRTALQDAVLLVHQGATNAAGLVLENLDARGKDEDLVREVTSYVKRRGHSEHLQRIQTLLAAIEQKATTPDNASRDTFHDYARPRVIACMGPSSQGGGTSAESAALLYQVCLSSALQAAGGFYVLEKRELETVLAELGYSKSTLTDGRASVEVGKALPASLFVFGDLFQFESGDRIALRLVETESGKVIETFMEENEQDADPFALCSDLAGRIATGAHRARPLTARVLSIDGNTGSAGVGSFHLATENMNFHIKKRVKLDKGFKEVNVGVAAITALGDIASEFSLKWSGGGAPAAGEEYWVVENIAGAGP